MVHASRFLRFSLPRMISRYYTLEEETAKNGGYVPLPKDKDAKVNRAYAKRDYENASEEAKVWHGDLMDEYDFQLACQKLAEVYKKKNHVESLTPADICSISSGVQMELLRICNHISASEQKQWYGE